MDVSIEVDGAGRGRAGPTARTMHLEHSRNASGDWETRVSSPDVAPALANARVVLTGNAMRFEGLGRPASPQSPIVPGWTASNWRDSMRRVAEGRRAQAPVAGGATSSGAPSLPASRDPLAVVLIRRADAERVRRHLPSLDDVTPDGGATTRRYRSRGGPDAYEILVDTMSGAVLEQTVHRPDGGRFRVVHEYAALAGGLLARTGSTMSVWSKEASIPQQVVSVRYSNILAR